MGLSKKEYAEIGKELEASERPFFLFHDDPDGLVSFLLLKRFAGKGFGRLVKAQPNVDSRFTETVISRAPDSLFVLDVAQMEKSFVADVKKVLPKLRIFWIDHHQPAGFSGVNYFNPRLHAPANNPPVSYLCHKVVEKAAWIDGWLWVSMTGIVSDWHMPEFAGDFVKKYPALLPAVMRAEEALFTTPIGRLSRIFSFMLKGATSDVFSCIKALERIELPEQLLDNSGKEARFINSRVRKTLSRYRELLARCKSVAESTKEDRFLIFTYRTEQSFSGDLANELLFLYPDRIIVVGREKADSIMLSFRSRNTPVLPALKRALEGVDGYGGGHENACGGSVRLTDFSRFIERFRKEF